MTSPLTTTTVKKDVGDFYALVDGIRMGGARSPVAMRTTTVDESAREKDDDDGDDDDDDDVHVLMQILLLSKALTIKN